MATYQTIKERVRESVSEALRKLKLETDFSVEYPVIADHGDYSTNVALNLASKLKQLPQGIAYKVVSNFPKNKDVFEKVEIAGNGFINFFLRPDFIRSQVQTITQENFGELSMGKGQKVNIEFISANPTGPLTLGNSRGAFFGDVLSNVLKITGFNVTKEYYVNDAKNSNQIKELGKTVLGKGEIYKSDYLLDKIKNFKQEGFKLDTLDEAGAGYLVARSIQEDIEEFITADLKIKFNKWFHEQNLYEKNEIKKTFDYLSKRNLVYEKDGASWIKTAEFGDKQDWVLIRSQRGASAGEPTYFLSDIAYHFDKFKRGYDIVIDILGPDHQAHVKRMEAVARMYDFKGKFVLFFTQVVRFKEDGLAVKLSKRMGKTVNLDWLLEQIGLDAARYFYLTKSINSHIDFDVDLAKSKNLQNPIFYIQYAHARLASILRKAKQQKLEINFKATDLLKEEEELQLIKRLLRFPEFLADISRDYQVHNLTHYLLSLATLSNSFYEKIRIISEDKKLSSVRLSLISATKNVIFKTLQLLGINAPLKM